MVYNKGKNDKKGVRESFFHRNRAMMNIDRIKKNPKKSVVVLSVALLIVVAVVFLQYKPFEGPYQSAKPLLSEPEMVMAAANKKILPPKEAERALNVLLMGIDDRSSGFGGRTDSIIIATIDFSSDSIRLTSVLRDKLDTFMLTLPASGDYQSGFLDGQSVILPNLQDTAEKFHQFATPGIEIKGLTVPDNSIQFQRLNNS